MLELQCWIPEGAAWAIPAGLGEETEMELWKGIL
jgi:hypothetical protein